jgi:putative endonuclease
MKARLSFVYIMANHKGGTFYIGVTNNLIRRVYEHKNKITKGFTEKYNLTRLVYYEIHEDITYAIKREKNIKAWQRMWKVRLIENFNPKWEDLYYHL